MLRRGRILAAVLLLGASGLLAWQLWPREAPPPEAAVAALPLPQALDTARAQSPIGATVVTTTSGPEPQAEALLRKLEPWPSPISARPGPRGGGRCHFTG